MVALPVSRLAAKIWLLDLRQGYDCIRHCELAPEIKSPASCDCGCKKTIQSKVKTYSLIRPTLIR